MSELIEQIVPTLGDSKLTVSTGTGGPTIAWVNVEISDRVYVGDDVNAEMSPEQAREFAALLLRTADQVEQLRSKA